MNKIINLILGKSHACPLWLCPTFDNSLRRAILNPYEILKPYIKKGDSVLDLGPGRGSFTFPISDMVGAHGIVYAVDIQKDMLEIIERKAKKKNIENIRTILIENSVIDIDFKVNFILAFWMFHEVTEKKAMLKQLNRKLKSKANLLIVEPIIHVSRKKFTIEVQMAKNAGFDIVDYPKVSISNAVLLAKR